MSKPRILFLQRQNSAVTYYRQDIPARILTKAGYDTKFENRDIVTKGGYALSDFLQTVAGTFDLLFVDRGVSFAEIGGDEERGLIGYHAAACSGDARMLVDFDDDFTCVPKWNQAYGFFQPGQEQYEAGLAHLQLAEMTTVTTNELATRFRDRAHRIRVLPNVIDFADWEHHPVNPYRPRDPRVRLFYGGAAGHYGDLDVLEDAMVAFIEDPPCPVRWIVRGAAGRWVYDLSRRFPERVVVLPWTPFEDYPAATAWGGFDLAIAPLAQHPFNDCKCLVGSTRVVTPLGIQTLGHLSAASVWQGSHSGWKNIAATVRYPQRETRKIRTKLGYVIEGTPNHRVLSRGVWKALEDLRPGDKISLDTFTFPELPEPTIPGPFLLCKKLAEVQPEDLDSTVAPKVAITPDWSRFFGLVLGDGCISSANLTSISCDAQDTDLIDWLVTFGERIGLMTPQVLQRSPRGVSVGFNSRNLQWLLRAGGLGSGQTRKKTLTVPPFIWHSPKSLVAAFLSGLFEADGTVQASGCSWTTKSETLAQDVQFLLLGFGIHCRLQQSFNKVYRKNYYTLFLGRQAADRFAQEIDFLSKRKREKLRQIVTRTHSNAYKEWLGEDEIDSILCGLADVYDIQVPDGEFYLANGIISHNSNIKALEAAAQGIPFLASRVGPYRDLPTEGFVTVPNTPDAWLTALRDLTTDRDRRATLAAKAKEWTHDTHTPARVRKRWVDAVEEALAARPIRSLRDTWVPALGPFPG